MRVPHSSRCCLSGSFLPYRPPRSNFNHSFFSRDIVTITAPRPVFRSLDEPSCDRITVDVFQLLGALGATPDIEIVIAWLPEVFATSDETPRDGLFQGFQSLCENGAVPEGLESFFHCTQHSARRGELRAGLSCPRPCGAGFLTTRTTVATQTLVLTQTLSEQ